MKFTNLSYTNIRPGHFFPGWLIAKPLLFAGFAWLWGSRFGVTPPHRSDSQGRFQPLGVSLVDEPSPFASLPALEPAITKQQSHPTNSAACGFCRLGHGQPLFVWGRHCNHAPILTAALAESSVSREKSAHFDSDTVTALPLVWCTEPKWRIVRKSCVHRYTGKH